MDPRNSSPSIDRIEESATRTPDMCMATDLKNFSIPRTRIHTYTHIHTHCTVSRVLFRHPSCCVMYLYNTRYVVHISHQAIMFRCLFQ